MQIPLLFCCVKWKEEKGKGKKSCPRAQKDGSNQIRAALHDREERDFVIRVLQMILPLVPKKSTFFLIPTLLISLFGNKFTFLQDVSSSL